MMAEEEKQNRDQERAQEILDLTYNAIIKNLSNPNNIPPVNQLATVWNTFSNYHKGESEAPQVEIKLPEEANEYAE